MSLPNQQNNTDEEILAAYDELAAAEAGECELSSTQEHWMFTVETLCSQLLAR